MDSHLKAIPGLRTFSTGCLAGSDLEALGRETDWALDTELLALRTLNELLADLLERGDLAAGERNADLVDLGAFAEGIFLWLVVGHFGGFSFKTRMTRTIV